jgi:Terpene cyclase DEP1
MIRDHVHSKPVPAKPLMMFYGVLSIGGLFGTWWFNSRSGDVEGGYLQGWFANAASSSAAVDLLVVFAVLSVFMVLEGRRVGMRWPWVYSVLALPTAIAFTFPLFLLLRERRLLTQGRR